MTEKRTINKIMNRNPDIRLYLINTQIAFIELCLDCDNQNFNPKEESHFDKLVRLTIKIKNQLDIADKQRKAK